MRNPTTTRNEVARASCQRQQRNPKNSSYQEDRLLPEANLPRVLAVLGQCQKGTVFGYLLVSGNWKLSRLGRLVPRLVQGE